MREKSKGGTREGAGRKPTTDPKQPVTIFVKTSVINAYGGKEGVQTFCYNAIEFGEAITSHAQEEINPPGPKKKFPSSDREIKQKAPKEEKRPIVADLTRPTGVLELHQQPKTNFSINTKPKTLDELKALCPHPEKSDERSNWVRIERQKYGI